MALVMAVAAIDSYMHAVVLRRVATVRRRADLPKALGRLQMPFSELGDLADAAIAARKRNTQSRPWVQVKGCLQKRLLKETFQSFDQVGTALSMAGIEHGWTKIATKLGETQDDIRDWLNAIVHRRNQIVHEGDLQRASRPRRLKFNAIEKRETRDDIDWIESLIKAMEKVISAHP